mmetsp:Transcript_26007/g.47154  ORF Transcript_26007/g.47154 Transcript_26007/m.47154 type:complete len:85 (+) Transcript_26007:130-384(+)
MVLYFLIHKSRRCAPSSFMPLLKRHLGGSAVHCTRLQEMVSKIRAVITSVIARFGQSSLKKREASERFLLLHSENVAEGCELTF